MLSYGKLYGDDKEVYAPPLTVHASPVVVQSPTAPSPAAATSKSASGAASPSGPQSPKGSKSPAAKKPNTSEVSPDAHPQEGADQFAPAPQDISDTGSSVSSVDSESSGGFQRELSRLSQSIVESKYFTLICTISACIIIVILILAGAGQVGLSTPKRKALIVLVDGIKANVFEEIAVNGIRAPNLKQAIASGSHAACVSKSDTRCAKTQTGALLGGQFSYQSAPGLASILTGVDASVHQVFNTSFNAMLQFAQSALDNPTFLQTAVSNGLRTAAIGGNSLLTTIGTDSACSNYGVLDFECGAAALSRCMRSTSCNLVDRVPLISTTNLPDRQAEADTLSETMRLINAGSDVIVVHINRPNIAATDPADGGNFTSASRLYAAQIYYADAIIGQLLAVVNKRAQNLRETWLVVGTSDHGGHNSTFGTVAGDDNIVPLWGALYSANGPVPLPNPRLPASQMDIAPTVLEWFNLLTPGNSARMSGRVQFLCGVASASNCTALGFK